jgi:flagellar hook-basal body complex protein FliE
MAAIGPIAAVAGGTSSPAPPVSPPGVGTGGFGDLLAAGLRQLDVKVAAADALLRGFAEGEAIPVHQVTLALEQARLAVELAAQVRGRLVETYRDLMNMQL